MTAPSHHAPAAVSLDAVTRPAGSATIRNRVTGPIAALVAALGLAVLVGGWGFDIELLTRVVPGLESMKPDAALCFVLAGTTLWLLDHERLRHSANLLARALAIAAGAVGLATLVEYTTGLDLGIDQLLFADPKALGPHPGRMAPATAVSFVLFALSLLTLSLRAPSRATLVAGDCAALAAGFLGQLTLLGYLYGASQFYEFAGFTAMALHTSAAVVALAVSIVLAHGRSPLSRILLDKGIVGRTTRRLLAVTILTILILSLLRMIGQSEGLYGTEFGLALFATSVITVLTSVLLWTAAALRRFESAERRALQMARLRGDQFGRLVANVPGAVFTRQMDASGNARFTYLSPQFNGIFGIDPAAALRDSNILFDRVHRDDRQALFASIVEATGTFVPWAREFRIVRPGGEVRWVRSQATPYRTATGETAWDGIVLDITEQKDRDEQLRQAQKMEAVGQLTGGVAHDFNNLLTVILGNAELLCEALSGDARLKRTAELVRIAAERSAELTKRLLAFSRKQALDPKVVDVGGLVRHMLPLLRSALGDQVEIALQLDPDLRKARIDPGQLEAAILNLAVNSRDAMPSGGKFTIEAVNAEIDRDYAKRNEGAIPGPYVMVAVSDTGTGMPLDVAARAFDPFFTTKEVGKGSGLGLSMVYGFIKQSNGHVKIYSEPGHGTTVKLYLPPSTGAGRAEAPAGGALIPSGGRETILMVEDDDLVRSHVESQLGALGYRVLAARDGPEALEVLRRNPDVDLLFTDIVMPGGMNGRRLAEEARRRCPALKVLFTSGYTDNAIVHHGNLDPGIELLSKPYTRERLATRLRAVLDGPSG